MFFYLFTTSSPLPSHFFVRYKLLVATRRAKLKNEGLKLSNQEYIDYIVQVPFYTTRIDRFLYDTSETKEVYSNSTTLRERLKSLVILRKTSRLRLPHYARIKTQDVNLICNQCRKVNYPVHYPKEISCKRCGYKLYY